MDRRKFLASSSFAFSIVAGQQLRGSCFRARKTGSGFNFDRVVTPNMHRRTIAGLVITLATAVAGVVSAPQLPGRLATHWSASGVVDGSTPKLAVLVGFPLLTLGFVVLFEGLPRLDPLGENVEEFRRAYDAMAVGIVAFLAYTYGIVLAWNLGYEFAVTQALAPAIAAVFVGVGFLLERAERNWVVGIRTPWTLSSDAVWRHTHDRVAPLFKLAGVLALAGLVVPKYFLAVVVAPAVAIAVYATVYSYVEYRRIGNGEPANG